MKKVKEVCTIKFEYVLHILVVLERNGENMHITDLRVASAFVGVGCFAISGCLLILTVKENWVLALPASICLVLSIICGIIFNASVCGYRSLRKRMSCTEREYADRRTQVTFRKNKGLFLLCAGLEALLLSGTLIVALFRKNQLFQGWGALSLPFIILGGTFIYKGLGQFAVHE